MPIFIYSIWGDSYGEYDSHREGMICREGERVNQVIFALNERWLLNEKRAVRRIEDFQIRPDGYSQKVERIVEGIVTSPEETAGRLKELCDEVRKLVFMRGSEQYETEISVDVVFWLF